MDYTAVIMWNTETYSVGGYRTPQEFNKDMADKKHWIAWAHLFETDSGNPVVNFYSNDEAVKLGIIKEKTNEILEA